jgi:hypothetical protein
VRVCLERRRRWSFLLSISGSPYFFFVSLIVTFSSL